MDSRVYWIWLQTALGYGSKLPECILAGESAKTVFDMVDYPSCEYSAGKVNRLVDKDLTKAQEILAKCEEKGYSVICYCDEAYPSSLRKISAPPLVLYVSGKVDFENEVFLAIVGARKASRYSIEVVSKLSNQLSQAGFTLVSGGALGVDSAAHTGAILAGGRTVAVLGCGIDYNYLRTNKTLRESIASNGAVISEFPPDYPAGVSTFPIRNRIISGLSLGVIVAEANLRSGSLITAKHAVEQNKDLFAIPGGIFNQSFDGVNKLLKDGAKPVYSVDDIADEYANRFPDKLNFKGISSSSLDPSVEVMVKKHDTEEDVDFTEVHYPANLTPKAQAVYDALSLGEKHVNEICDATGFTLGEVLGELTLLELDEHVEALPGKRYVQKR